MVDIDITKFFDHVNHDILMGRIAAVIRDKRMLRLIGKFLRAGAMVDGVVISSEEGTPQGGPLSPLLANIYLDALDQELTRRGHSFCRYADCAYNSIPSKAESAEPGNASSSAFGSALKDGLRSLRKASRNSSRKSARCGRAVNPKRSSNSSKIGSNSCAAGGPSTSLCRIGLPSSRSRDGSNA